MNDSDRAEVQAMIARAARVSRAEAALALRVLRDEIAVVMAAEVAAITQRIDTVHRTALRELTSLRAQKGTR